MESEAGASYGLRVKATSSKRGMHAAHALFTPRTRVRDRTQDREEEVHDLTMRMRQARLEGYSVGKQEGTSMNALVSPRLRRSEQDSSRLNDLIRDYKQENERFAKRVEELQDRIGKASFNMREDSMYSLHHYSGQR